MTTLMCSKCLDTFPKKEVRVRKDEQVCKRCHNMLDFLDQVLAEKQEVQKGRRSGRTLAPTPPPKSPTLAFKPPETSPAPVGPSADIGPQTRANAIAEIDSQGRQWYAVTVYGGDTKAARNIRDYFSRRNKKAVGKVLIPKKYQEVVVSDKIVVQYRRAMPGYLLVKCRPDCLDELSRAPHVADVLPYSDPIEADKYERMERDGETPPAPVPIPQAQVLPFMRKGPKPVSSQIEVGDLVRVRLGQWEGQAGDVVGVVEEEVTMTVSILGVPTEISEPSINLQKLARD